MTWTAVVTGASAGVGRAIARELGARKARVGLIARGADGLEAARAEIESLGGEAITFSADVADADAVEAAAALVEETFGPIDVWINDAMVTVLSPVVEMTAEEFRRVTEVNYLGAVHGTLAALRRMKPRDHGHILQIGSALSYRAIPLQSAYCASKFALRGFTDSLRTELLHDASKVLITSVHLPAVNTPQFGWCRARLDAHPQPVPPIYEPEVPAKVVVDTIGLPRREVWVGVPAWKAILGNKIAPRLGDRILAKEAYGGQQAETLPFDRNRPDNLFHPLPRDRGARGAFSGRARTRSPQATLVRWFMRAMHRLRSLLGVPALAWDLDT